MYHVSINEMLEDRDLIQELTGQRCDADGIAWFGSKTEKEKDRDWAEEIKKNGWIRRNWESIQNTVSPRDEAGERIASLGGIILEIGAGPGGGHMPSVLKADPDATIIINDLSPTVVREWKTYLDRTLDSPNIYYAVFNFCHMPFADNSIDVISDGGGIGNCEKGTGTKEKALKEAYRVLKPGGVLVMATGFVTKETLAALPPEAQKVLLEKRPEIFEDLYEATVLAGFSKINSIISGCWYTEDDESTIADLARLLGVNLKFTRYIRFCTKE